ncbi:hypothetical protein JCM8202_003681 [Rhodotorula sphaerocarpa]
MPPSGPELDPLPLGGHHLSHFEDRCDALRVLLDPYAQLQYIRNQLAACRDQPGPTTDLAELLLLLHLVDTTATVTAVPPSVPPRAPLGDVSAAKASDSLGSVFGAGTSGQADRSDRRSERSRTDQGPGPDADTDADADARSGVHADADADADARSGVHAEADADVHAGPDADAAPEGDRGTRTGPRTDRATGAEEVPPQQEWVRRWAEWVHQNSRLADLLSDPTAAPEPHLTTLADDLLKHLVPTAADSDDLMAKLRARRATMADAPSTDQPASPRSGTPQARRRVLSTLLARHVSPTFADPASNDYALLEASCPTPGTAIPTSVGRTHQEPDDDGDTRSLSTGIRDAQASIARTDDKLTWLLGDNFRLGNAGAAAAPPPSSRARTTAAKHLRFFSTHAAPRREREAREPLATAAFSSKVSAPLSTPSSSSHSTSFSAPFRFGLAHLRQHSTTSTSMRTPLLRHRRSVSTEDWTSRSQHPDSDASRCSSRRIDAGARPGLLRKRSLSTGDQYVRDGGTGWWSRREGWDRSDMATRPPPSAIPTEKPFGNLVRAEAQGEGALPALYSEATATATEATREGPPGSRRPNDPDALTLEERRDLVRRSKKLEGFFGVPFQEGAAQRLLLSESRHTSRPLSTGGLGASSSDSATHPVRFRRNYSLAGPVSPLSPTTLLPSPPVSPYSFSQRRPSHAPSEASSALGSTSAGGFRRRSSSSPAPSSPSAAFFSPSTSTSFADPLYRRGTVAPRRRSAVEREERRRKLDKVRRFLGERVPAELVVEPRRQASAGGGQADAIGRAVFGALPPASLFLPPATSASVLRPGLQHRRSLSDTLLLSSSYPPYDVADDLSSEPGSPPGRPSPSLRRASSSASTTAETYRRSIASLSYISEHSPEALEEVVAVYAARSAEEGSESAAEQEEERGEEVGGAAMGRSLSAQSARMVKQAQKLSQLLGTTKGEVWHLLLRDLEESVLEDPDLDDEARADLLGRLERLLRASVSASPGRSDQDPSIPVPVR